MWAENRYFLSTTPFSSQGIIAQISWCVERKKIVKSLWNLLVSPAIFGLTLVTIASRAVAETTAITISPWVANPDKSTVTADSITRSQPLTVRVADRVTPKASVVETPSGAAINLDNTSIDSDRPMAQVTSVSQLSDVQPTDWAFQALQSLVERYGCIAGYPNGKYRGNQVLSRYEFAAGLNACLDRVNELIATGSSRLVRKEDVTTLQKLQAEFTPELTSLRGRVDTLEANVAQLEANQFSTTTKLNADATFAVVGVAAGQNANGEKIDRVTTFGDRVRLNFDTSFTGQDLLRIRLQALNLNALSGTSTLTPEGDLAFAGETFGRENNNSVGLGQLSYSFPVGKRTTVFVEANAAQPEEFIDTFNPYFDDDEGANGAISNFGTHNPIYDLVSGAGLAVNHNFSDNLGITLGYIATTPSVANPTAGNGLFNGPYSAIAQLAIKPSKRFKLGLTYVNSYNNDLTAGSRRANLRSYLASISTPLPPASIGASAGNAQPSDTLAAFGGINLPTSSNSYAVEASWQVTPKFIINGWVGYTATRTLSSLGGTINRGDLSIWNYAIALGFPDLGKEGNLAGIIVGMEPKVTGVTRALRAQIGTDASTSMHIEGFYQYQVTDNISITPGLIWITAPDHNNANADDVIGAIRTTFTF